MSSIPTRWRRRSTAICAAIGPLAVCGLFGIWLMSHAHPTKGALGLRLTNDGAIEIVSVQCPGRGIGAIVIRRERDGAEVFRAVVKAGVAPETRVAVRSGPDRAFELSMPVGELSPSEIYEIVVLQDDAGRRIDSQIHRFRLSDLSSTGVVGGLSVGDRLRTPPTVMQEFESQVLACG